MQTNDQNAGRLFVVGGAGFIGSHIVDALLADPSVAGVTVYDNFSSGRSWHLEQHAGSQRLAVVRGNAGDANAIRQALQGHDVVIHLASNPDIARAVREPSIDFDQGTVLTKSVLEAMRLAGVSRILYASGSGVYGDVGATEVDENFGPLIPISTYGASKLAGEALISSYCAMFGLTACVFRFANVVGSRQTHGVGFDFVRRLLKDPTRLVILGDGQQSKSYIHVSDVVQAILVAHRRSRREFDAFNVATGDYITVREIADLAIETLKLPRLSVAIEYTGGDRGWRGDVPVVRLRSDRIRSLGWNCRRGCHEALKESLLSLITDSHRLYGARDCQPAIDE